MSDRTSISAYKSDVEVMKDARREMQTELGTDLALHEAIMVLVRAYENGRVILRESDVDATDTRYDSAED